MDECEFHHRALRVTVAELGVDPDGHLCPDLRRIANGDGDLADKGRQVAQEVRANGCNRRRTTGRR